VSLSFRCHRRSLLHHGLRLERFVEMGLVALVGELRGLPRKTVSGSVHWVRLVLQRIEVVGQHRVEQDVIECVKQGACDCASLPPEVVPNVPERVPGSKSFAVSSLIAIDGTRPSGSDAR
jgi:hypothetical protein